MGLLCVGMLYDRDYMRDEDRLRWFSPVIVLLAAMVALFFVESWLVVFHRWSLAQWFGLNLTGIANHQYWRLLTYLFLHLAPWPLHLLFNGVSLWYFGGHLRENHGTRRFWQIFLITGLAGAAFELASQAWHPAYGPNFTVGASASVAGLIGAFCFLYPDRDMVFFLYVIPVRLRAMMLFWVTFGYSLFGTIFPHGGIAHAAHLGGVLAGAGFARWFIQEDGWAWLRGWMSRSRVVRQPVPVAATALRVAGKAARGDAAGGPEPESPEEFMRREVDPILDKISAHGLQSLTEKERCILERARQRMGGR